MSNYNYLETSNFKEYSKYNYLLLGLGLGNKGVEKFFIYNNIKYSVYDDIKDNSLLNKKNYLEGKNLAFVNEKAYLGTLKAHEIDGNVPNIVITMDEMNSYNLGYLFYFFMRACALSAYLMDINPFNQPGVEIYKYNMFKLLGKPGIK